MCWVCNGNNKKNSKSTVAIDGTQKDCSNRRNRMQPSKTKILEITDMNSNHTVQPHLVSGILGVGK
jgi:hypothetical protein